MATRELNAVESQALRTRERVFYILMIINLFLSARLLIGTDSSNIVWWMAATVLVLSVIGGVVGASGYGEIRGLTGGYRRITPDFREWYQREIEFAHRGTLKQMLFRGAVGQYNF